MIGTENVERKRKPERVPKGTKKKKKEEKKKEEDEEQQFSDPEEEPAQQEATPKIHNQIPTPEYVPPEFSSDKEMMSADEAAAPIQPYANVDLVTFDSLNAYNVQKLIQERDRLEFSQLRKLHPLLHQIDRTQWRTSITSV